MAMAGSKETKTVHGDNRVPGMGVFLTEESVREGFSSPMKEYILI